MCVFYQLVFRSLQCCAVIEIYVLSQSQFSVLKEVAKFSVLKEVLSRSHPFKQSCPSGFDV